MDFSLDIPELNLNSHSEDDDQNIFNQDKFVDLLKQLHTKSILYYCPYDDHSLRNFYHQIISHQDAQYLDLQTVHQFISELKEKNRNYIGIQIQYYQQKLKQYVNSNVDALSRKEFHKIIDLCQSHNLMTTIFLQKLKDTEFVSCMKLLTILKEAKYQLQDAIIPQISITKLKTLRFNKSSIFLDETVQNPNQGLAKPMFDEIEEYQINNLFSNYITFTHRKLSYYSQFIGDIQIRENIVHFQQTLKVLQQKILQEIKNMIYNNQNLSEKYHQFHDIYAKVQEEEELYNIMLNKKNEELQNMREELKEEMMINQRIRKQNNQFQEIVNTFQNDFSRLNAYCFSLEQQLAEWRKQYQEINKEYTRLEEINQKQQLKKMEEGSKIFVNRTLKQQLQETNQRLNRILSERQREKKVFKDKQQKNVDKIYLLQNHIDQLETQLKLKMSTLHDYFRQSTLFNPKDLAFRMSKISSINATAFNPYNSIKVNQNEAENHKTEQDKIKDRQKDERKSIIERLSLKDQVSHGKVEKKLQQQSLLKMSLHRSRYIKQLQNNLNDIHILYPQESISKVINEDSKDDPQDSINEQGRNFKKVKSKTQRINKTISLDQNKIWFFSKGLIINQSGIKFQTTMMFTAKRFCLFDSKMRIEKYIALQKVQSIIFCLENPNIFVIKPHRSIKDSPVKNQQKAIIQDMILCSRQTNKFLDFCKMKHELLNKKYKINVKIQEQINIYVKFQTREYNLKLKVPNIRNVFRYSLAKEKVFYLKIKEEKTFFDDDYNSIVIIQPVGFLCFKGNEVFQLQKQREFLFLLPMVQELQVKIGDKDKEKYTLTLDYQSFNLSKIYTFLFRDSIEFSSFLHQFQNYQAIKKKEKACKLQQKIQLQKYYKKE